MADERSAADRAALAADALVEAIARARATQTPPAPLRDNFLERNRGTSVSPALGRPASRRRLEDPAPLEAAIGGLIAASGWELDIATGSVFGRWAQIVGPDLAAHTSPEALVDGEMIVSADSTAWATQLRLLARDLVRRLNAELGDGTVRRVQVRGPGTQARKPGQWRVKGSRGPRDTYG
ncbi:MAG TPA: DciA family protein [Streptosporangiaceae bacterium]|nr:DciA family protein [Streptosporangiaceae bacterium]